jgi:uncharacterized membrane protein YqjE
MWTSALKFIAILFLKNRMEYVRSHFFDKQNTNSSENLNKLKLSIAAMAESRAAIFKQNFHFEVRRIVSSLFGFMLILLATMLSLLTGLMWLFASAWVSSYRDIILGTTMILPILIAAGVYLYIRRSWQKQPILHQSMVQIESDWQVFRAGLDGTADISDEANR